MLQECYVHWCLLCFVDTCCPFLPCQHKLHNLYSDLICLGLDVLDSIQLIDGRRLHGVMIQRIRFLTLSCGVSESFWHRNSPTSPNGFTVRSLMPLIFKFTTLHFLHAMLYTCVFFTYFDMSFSGLYVGRRYGSSFIVL